MLRVAATAIASIALLATVGAASPRPDGGDPERVLVRGTEFELTLSKQKLRPGRVVVQFLNDGEDPHDLRLRRAGDPGAPELAIGELGPGEYENLDTRLRRRSTYVLWCSLAGHRELGMEASLRTKRRRGR
jgi:hypothetical protein